MSASGDWGDAPPGVDLSEHQSDSIISTVTAVMSLAVIAVVLRLVARYKAASGLATDDYLIFLALVSRLISSHTKSITVSMVDLHAP